MIFIRHPFQSDLKCLEFEEENVRKFDIHRALVPHFGYQDFTLYYNGRKTQDTDVIPRDSIIHVTLSLPGGKGGFGSMLRAIGAQIEKTTNREACRDLSGRRLRDINEEQRLKKWISKEAERKAEKLRRRQERLERLKKKPTHNFFDFEYEKEISQVPECVNEALSEGLRKAKRPAEEAGSSQPLKKTWLTEEFLSSSDSDSEVNTSSNESAASKQKIGTTDSDMSDVSQPGPSSQYETPFGSEESSQFNSGTALRSDPKNEAEYMKSKISQIENTGNDSTSRNIADDDNINLSEQKDIKDPTVLKNQTKDSVNSGNDESDSMKEQQDEEKESESDKCETPLLEESKVDQPDKKLKHEEEKKEFLPINLQDFQSISDFEALGLDRLKLELMHRGLKCGGTLSDRAKRLWQVRGLKPSEYPANLLTKNKK